MELPQPRSGREVQAVMAADRAGLPYLLYRDGEEQLVILTLPETGRATVGRHSSSDIALPWDDVVSRSHAVLERVGREWTLVDDGISRNGSFVNGERIRGRRRLDDDDRVRFGATLMRYRRTDGPRSVAVTRVDDALPEVKLTAKQHEVLVALCRPCVANRFATPASNPQIAQELFLSVDAVKTHIRGIFERFDVEDLPQNQKRARVVELAIKSGMVGGDG